MIYLENMRTHKKKLNVGVVWSHFIGSYVAKKKTTTPQLDSNVAKLGAWKYVAHPFSN